MPVKPKALVWIALLTLLALAACAQPPAPPAVAPTIPVLLTPVTPAPTPTPIPRATLPPTWTPFVPPPTETPVIVPTLDLTATAIMLTPTREICAAFLPDSARTDVSFPYGNPALIAWLPFEIASTYDVRVYDATTDAIVLHTITGANELMIPETYFALDGSYYWLVYPLDVNRVVLCPPIGGVMFPVVP
jgi:hypothetical protein